MKRSPPVRRALKALVEAILDEGIARREASGGKDWLSERTMRAVARAQAALEEPAGADAPRRGGSGMGPAERSHARPAQLPHKGKPR